MPGLKSRPISETTATATTTAIALFARFLNRFSDEYGDYANSRLQRILDFFVRILALPIALKKGVDRKIFFNCFPNSFRVFLGFGYGDFYPVTVNGRLVAVLLMIGGISLIGMITAMVATWIVQRVAEEDNTKQAATAAQIDELRSQIAELTTLLIDKEDAGVIRAPASDR